ncbi:solute carrier family 23 protein, partial [Shewanella algae]|uniref:solute carrier family 23 protein n=1 Tax=Shewanella algae TaxID=38313 RepID=UPI00313DC0F1
VIVGYVATVLIQAASGETLIDFAPVEAAPWIGLPDFQLADFATPQTWSVIAMFLPVVLVLVAENVGHVRGVAAMTDAT